VARAILGRYLNWLLYFGEPWLLAHTEKLFPETEKALRNAAWVAHIQSDQRPVPQLTGALHHLYSEHIAALGGDDSAFGGNGSRNRLIEYLMILYLWEKLPEDLLLQLWQQAPASLLQRAMWFIGRHLAPDNALKERAMTYWDRRLELAKTASNKEPFRKELGTISVWFLREVDPLWLMDQLLLMLNAGFAPNSGIGVIDKLAQQVPERIDQVIEIVRALVRHPDVEPWIIGSQEQSLRKVLEEGKKSPSPITVAGVKEIISYLSSKGKTSFLDLEEGL
jgi:hypothetical protein